MFAQPLALPGTRFPQSCCDQLPGGFFISGEILVFLVACTSSSISINP